MRAPVARLVPASLGLVSLAAASLAPAADAATSEEVVLGMVRAINERDWDGLAEWVADDVHRHSGATPDLVVENRDAFVAFLEQDLTACPDAVQEVERIFSSGDMVAVRAMYRGTQTGPMGPFPPSGRRLELPFNAILRVHDGKVAEIWVEWDNVNALTQLGHFPPPGVAGDATELGSGGGSPPTGEEEVPMIRNTVVPASCGQCRFGMEGEGCSLAVKIDGVPYWVEGTGIDDHGDAHAADGFCETVRQAEVTGRIEGDKFHAVAFRLLPEGDPGAE